MRVYTMAAFDGRIELAIDDTMAAVDDRVELANDHTRLALRVELSQWSLR